MAASWAEEVQDYQHERRVKVHPDLFKGRTVGYVRGENSKRERSYNPLLGRFLDQHREREQQDFEEKVKKNYLNMARDIQLRKEAPYDLITHERKFEALVPEALDPAKPKELKCPVPDTAVDYNIISNLRFDAHHWAHPQKRPIPKDRVPKARMVPALLHKDFNILTNRYLEHHEEKVERDRELNLLEAAEKMRQQPFNPLSQKFCDARLEERMRACQDALTTEVKLRNEEAQPLSYRGNITNCYDMLSHQVKDPELMEYIKQSEGGRKVRYKTRFRFEEDVRHADVKQEDRVKRMKPLQIAHERFTTEMERGYDILTNQDFGHRKEKHEKFLHTPRTKPLLTPWQKVIEQTGEAVAGPCVRIPKPTGVSGARDDLNLLQNTGGCGVLRSSRCSHARSEAHGAMMRALEAIRSLRGAKASCKQRSAEFAELTEHLKRLWDHFGIPEFHRQLYLARYCSGKYQSDVLLKEVQALVKGKALVQRVMKAIESREEVLLRLSVLRSAFGDLELREPGTLGRCQLSEQLYCLRVMTAQAVQVLHSWRVSVAPVAGAGCVAGPGSRGACWPFTVSDGGMHWDDYLMHIMRNDSAVRQFAAVVELAPEIDPLLLHGAVGGIGPFQQGKLCPPCVDLQLQYLEQARLLLLEEELTLVLFFESRATTPGDRSMWSPPESRGPSRPSSRLVEELTAPLAIAEGTLTPPRPPSGRGSQGHSRPRSAAGARRRTRVPGQKKEEPPTRQRRSTSRKKKKPRVAMWKSQPPRMESRTAPESQELAGENGDEDIEKELKDLINAFQMTRKKSITDFQGVPKLMKGQTAAASEQRDARDAPERSVAKEDGDGDENIQAAADLKDDEVELVLRCGIDMARFQSVWNRFENDNAIHHDDVPSALARIGFVGPEKKWVEDAFSKVTEFNGVSREEFMQVVDLYDERQRENFEEKFISCDADGSGQMDIAEFGDFLRTIGIEPMKHVLQECFDEFDEDRSGQLSFDEFYKVMTLLAQREGFSKTEVQDFEAVFNKFDAFCHDEIDVQELQQVLMYVGIPTTISDCQMVAEIVDLDDSGYVDFQEFLMCMRLFRDRELAELKNKLQALGADDSESILPCEMLNLLHSTGYVADQEVVNEVLQEIGIEAEEQIGLGSLWKFLVIFRQREGLTRAETMRVRKAFKKYASGDEGDDELIREVQTDDIPKLLRLVGYTLALEDQKQLVAQVDIDRSASLNILELKKLVRFVRERRTRDLQATINKYDRSDTGVLSEREALKAFKDLGCLREELSVLPPEVLEDLQEGFLSHAAFTRSVQEYDELRRRQLIDSGGYTMEQMEQLRRQFSYYDWDDSGDVSKKELVQLIVDVFPDMAFDPDKRPLLLQIMRETDSDSNGKLDFSEFLQLMRTVEDLEQLTQLQKERSVIDETRFTSNEVSEFRNIFLAVTKGEPRMNLADFKEMMSPVCPMGDKNSHAISAMWMEICDSGSKMFDFPDFLLIMRRLLDMNFANMNQRLGRVSQRKTHQF